MACFGVAGARATPTSARGEAVRCPAAGAAGPHDGAGGEGDRRRQGEEVSQAVRGCARRACVLVQARAVVRADLGFAFMAAVS